ncbi:hypothetical protein NDU88_001867 [Pleurodeles waltl]|uniref:Secreted protein n=1 Tax=Pleurodeles waltl TaxID=8319 RepID=A0AAV7LYW8_PLEWA|nr:hypothetical protein NDU88_001867 [Pleurodeles waltl]
MGAGFWWYLGVALSVRGVPPLPCLCLLCTDGLLVRPVPGPPPRPPLPNCAPAGRIQGVGRGGRRGADPSISAGTPRGPPYSAPASTRSPPLTHRSVASSVRRSICGAAAAWARIRARSGNLFVRPAERPKRTPGVLCQFPHIPDNLSPHSSSAPRQDLHFRRARDGSSGIRWPPS